MSCHIGADDAVIHPAGDTYEFCLKHPVPVYVSEAAQDFTVSLSVRNKGVRAWDTSDSLRIAIMLTEEKDQDCLHPPCIVTGRVSLASRYVHPGEEVDFSFRFSVNLVPQGRYAMIFDLVVEQKYFLKSTGARRGIFPLIICAAEAATLDESVIITLPPDAPRRLWSLDPNVHSPNHAFHLMLGSKANLGQSGRVVVRFNWGPFFFRHYAHFIEFIVVLYSIFREHIGDGKRIVLIIGMQEFSSGNNPDVQRFFLNALFPRWECVHSIDEENLGEDVIDFDGFRQSTSMNRLLCDYADLVGAWFAKFRAQCIGRIDVSPSERQQRLAIYAKRSSSRSLAEEQEKALLTLLEEFGYRVEIIDFGTLAIESQIDHVQRAALLFGAHGNNLTNTIWLDTRAALIEIFPAGFHSFDFQVLCEIAGAKYLGIEGSRYGFVHREGTRLPGWTLLPQPYHLHDHHQDDIVYVPLDVVRTFLCHVE